MEKTLPPIPAKRYFTIGEVSELCGVKPYVLRYWEQEFTQLKPMKRRGNRRYYQHHEVLLIRRIRELLYEQGFTISGARNRLADAAAHRPSTGADSSDGPGNGSDHGPVAVFPGGRRYGDRALASAARSTKELEADAGPDAAALPPFTLSAAQVRQELLSIRGLLVP
jgi:DNA-binding transcriptional MerR regulator